MIRHKHSIALILCLIVPSLIGCGASPEDDMRARAEALAKIRRAEREEEEAGRAKKPSAQETAENPSASTEAAVATNSTPTKPAPTSVASSQTATAQAHAAQAATSSLPAGTAPQSEATPAPNASNAPAASLVSVGGLQPITNRRPPGTLTVEQRRSRSIKNMEKIAKAVAKFMRSSDLLAFNNLRNNSKEVVLSWRVGLLPALGYQELYEKFNLEEPWDSDHNIQLLPFIPDEFSSPERFDDKTNYLSLQGKNLVTQEDDRVWKEDYLPQYRATVGVVEVNEGLAVSWTEPMDFETEPEFVSQGIGGLREDGTLAIFATGEFVLIPTSTTNDKVAHVVSLANSRKRDAKSFGFKKPRAGLSGAGGIASVSSNGSAPSMASAGPLNAGLGQSNMGSGATQPTGSVDRGAVAAGVPMQPNNASPLSYESASRGAFPVPSSVDVQKSNEQLRDLFGDKVFSAKTNNQRSDVARSMLTQKASLAADQPGTYALLTIACNVATSAGDFSLVRNASQSLTSTFNIDPYEIDKKSIEGFGQRVANMQNPVNVQGFGEMAMRVVYGAAQKDEYAVAKSCLTYMQAMINQGDQSIDGPTITRLRGNIDAAEMHYQKIAASIEILARDPGDPTAATHVGGYLCFVKGNFGEGLPLLENSADEQLSRAARAERNAGGSATAPQMVQFGDAWWTASDGLTDPLMKRLTKGRALYWYERALPMLGETLDRLRAKSRLQSSEEEATDSLLASIQKIASRAGIKGR